mmetsp:Transcript_20629/g.50639  ORF Transcript_20629/g.50639 Transcript_20629/m.50639 type:complete len:256 (-) Transcript_20629:633-1400(-)
MVEDAEAELLLSEDCGPVAEEEDVERPVREGGRRPGLCLSGARGVADDVVALGPDQLLRDHEASVGRPVRWPPPPDAVQGERHRRRQRRAGRAPPDGVVVVGGEVHPREDVVVVDGLPPRASRGVRGDRPEDLVALQDVDLHVGEVGDGVAAEAPEVEEHPRAQVAPPGLVRALVGPRDGVPGHGDLVEVPVGRGPEHGAPGLVDGLDIAVVLVLHPRAPGSGGGLAHVHVAALVAELVVDLPDHDALPLAVPLR